MPSEGIVGGVEQDLLFDLFGDVGGFVEFDKQSFMLAVDVGRVVLPIVDFTAVGLVGRNRATDKREHRVTDSGFVIQHQRPVGWKIFEFQESDEIYFCHTGKKFAFPPKLQNAIFKHFDRDFGGVGFNQQIEFAMSTVRFFNLSLIGQVKKLANENHRGFLSAMLDLHSNIGKLIVGVYDERTKISQGFLCWMIKGLRHSKGKKRASLSIPSALQWGHAREVSRLWQALYRLSS